MEKIGVFGGTYNPPHMGHILAAREVRNALDLDRIIFIPDSTPPHKEVPEGSPSPQQRLEMVKTAVKDEPYAVVSDIEISRPGKSYTSDTLVELRKLHPDAELYLIMGTDMFLSLHTWHEPEVICSIARIAALQREDSNRSEEFVAQKIHLEQKYGAKIHLVDNSRIEISSTKVRRMLILGGVEKYLQQPVLDIIHENGLYGTARDYKNLPDEDLREVAISLLKKKRVGHVLGCAETAEKLAERYGADVTVARRAGLLHDITKAIDGPDQLLLVDKYGIIVSDFERKYPKLLHAKSGSGVAKYVFGESDDVCDAIYWHTTGRADMTLMEKIIYIADYMEPNRNFPGVEELREEVWKDLDKGLLMGMNMCIAELIREKKVVGKDTMEARDFLEAQLNATV